MRRVNRYRCGKCPYIYDPAKGDPDGGIPPGTPFSRIPESWRCPVCGASKRDFYPLDEASPARPQAAASTKRPVTEVSIDAQASSSPLPRTPPAEQPQWTVGSLKSKR